MENIFPLPLTDEDMAKLLTLSKAAEKLQVSITTLLDWEKKEILLPSYRFGSRKDRRYSEEDLDKFMEDRKEVLTLADVSEMLGVSKKTLRVWDKQGLLKSVRVGKRNDRRYKRSDVNTFMEKSRHK